MLREPEPNLPPGATPRLVTLGSARWARLCDQLGLMPQDPARERYPDIARAYAEPQRHYHTAQHISECLTWFDRVAPQLRDAPLVELALWLHDLVYDARRHDNEAQSARLAGGWMAGLGRARAAQLVRYIEATRHHAPSPQDLDLQALHDIDLSILGADWPRFQQFQQQISAEYAHLPPSVYNARRQQYLRTLAQRVRLFHHPLLAPDLEPRARQNLLVIAAGMPPAFLAKRG